jgi:molybdenum cofactor cytidylyltransferase
MRSPGLILLAAGGSSRMKKPKQLLRWGDSSLLQVACKTALQTECRPVIVVLGCEAEACGQEIADLPVTVVVNPEWQKGMGSSIAVGVSALESAAPETSGALFLLVDQPTVTPDLLNSLVKAWSPPKLPIAATSYGGSGGVPAIFAKTLFSELKALDPERGARALIAREISRTNLLDSGEALIDLDTPEIYEQQRPKLR